MKKNKTILTVILTLVLSVALLAGCAPANHQASRSNIGTLRHAEDKSLVENVELKQEQPQPTVATVELCNTCGDDDCDDGIYCDDAEDLAENLREAENKAKGIRCEVCGDYDCDDGVFCDDADELAENLREEAKSQKPATPKATEPKATEPKATEPKATEPKATEPVVTLCPVCGDDDCDDGIYCDDAEDLAENLREAENKAKGIRCEVCGDYDCDDGVFCDDADELAENLREEAKSQKPATPKATEPKATEPKATEPKATEPVVTLCPVCGDDDCDDGIYCDDAEDLAENLREAENKAKGIRCEVCGDYDCDDGVFCDDADELAENLREEAKTQKPATPKATEPKATEPVVTLCPVCGDDDCDDGIYCDDAEDLAENLREAENKAKGIRCEVCGDYDCDDGAYCDDWDERHDVT